jgi:ABC-2 type transport system permease protein
MAAANLPLDRPVDSLRPLGRDSRPGIYRRTGNGIEPGAHPVTTWAGNETGSERPMSHAPTPAGVEERRRAALPQRVVAAKRPMSQRLTEIWTSRELLWFLVRKELKVRYKNSVLGFLWSFLNPALVLLIYFVVFKYFLKNPTPDFALFLFSGLLAWNVFNNSLLSSSGVLVAHAGIVKKVAFPREILPLAQVGTAICYFFFQMCIALLFLAIFRVLPAFNYVPLMLLALLCDIVFSAALAVLLSAITVYLRDVQHFVEILLVALFFSPPIVYSYGQAIMPRHVWVHHLYLANPLAWIVLTFERCLFGRVDGPAGVSIKNVTPDPYKVLPSWGMATYAEGLGIVLLGSLILFMLAMVVFGKVEGNFAEEL